MTAKNENAIFVTRVIEGLNNSYSFLLLSWGALSGNRCLWGNKAAKGTQVLRYVLKYLTILTLDKTDFGVKKSAG